MSLDTKYLVTSASRYEVSWGYLQFVPPYMFCITYKMLVIQRKKLDMEKNNYYILF